MTITTLKVHSEVRDRIKAVARREGVTVGKLLEDLVAIREREQRFADIAQARNAMSTADTDSYKAETAQWEKAELMDGARIS